MDKNSYKGKKILEQDYSMSYKAPFQLEVKWPGEDAEILVYAYIWDAKQEATSIRARATYDNTPTIRLTDATGQRVSF